MAITGHRGKEKDDGEVELDDVLSRGLVRAHGSSHQCAGLGDVGRSIRQRRAIELNTAS